MTFIRPARTSPLAFALILLASALPAEDWPEWRGKGRLGVWNEDGIVDKLPEGELKPLWRTPVGGGYAGPAVAGGKVFLTDFHKGEGPGVRGIESAMALDSETGAVLWRREWPADYGALSYNCGPRATPTVDGERVYVQGSVGALFCLSAATGEAIWSKDYVKDFGAEVPIWGMAGAPIVHGDLLICLAAGEPNGKVMAFNKLDGREVWRALSSDWGPGYVQPIIVRAGGAEQLIIWHPKAVSALEPASGKILWEYPFDIKNDAPLAQPVLDGETLFITAFYDGSVMLKLDQAKPGASVVWKGTSDNEIKTTALHACHVAPFIQGDYIYGVCSYGQFRCLDKRTGERVWESFGPTVENKRWASMFIVRNGDRFFLNNDRGDLIIANLKPEGYEETSRSKLIKPTTGGAGRRELNAVNWSHPAYANRSIYQRNDEEIIRVSLAK